MTNAILHNKQTNADVHEKGEGMKSYRFGYFLEGQELPEYNPFDFHGYRLCPVCTRKIFRGEGTAKTISFMDLEDPKKSYFYSIHHKCRSEEAERNIESIQIKNDSKL